MLSSVSISLTNPAWKLIITKGKGELVKHDPKQGPGPRLCICSNYSALKVKIKVIFQQIYQGKIQYAQLEQNGSIQEHLIRKWNVQMAVTRQPLKAASP
jgi:hypothetical protein